MRINIKTIHSKALELGWNDAAITTPSISNIAINAYYDAIANGYHADMTYLENDARCFPKHFLPGAQSAIIFISHYKQPTLPFKKEAGLIASFARGNDYHTVHRKRLKTFIRWLEDTTEKKGIARGFSDSAPILEKPLATQAGLGGIGKNTLFIHHSLGSFVLLAGILTTIAIEHPTPAPLSSPCGSCRKCLDACPTQALITPYTLDARKCLAYHTIESKHTIPPQIATKNPGYIFGCDACQNACPHNTTTTLSTSPDFSPNNTITPYLNTTTIQTLTSTPSLLLHSPLKRSNPQHLLHTITSLR